MKEEVRYRNARLIGQVTAIVLAFVVVAVAFVLSTSQLAIQSAYADDGVGVAYAVDVDQTTGGGAATEANATHGESETGGISAILPDMIEFIPMLIAFIILWIILAKFGWPIFNNMLDKRENTIREALKKSEEAQVESERTLQEYQRQLADAKAQAAQILADARSAGETMKTDIIHQAQKESADMIAKAKEAIEAEKKQAIIDLQSITADNAVNLATRLVGEAVDEDEQRRIIARYISEAGSFNGN